MRDVVASASPELAWRLHTAAPPTGLRSFGGVPGYLRVPWGPGWALVGDAGYWKDPIGAHGLTDALRDAELLARAIVTTATGTATESEAFDRYHKLRNEVSLPHFELVDTIAAMRWTDAEIPGLLRGLSTAMSEEMDAMAALDDEPALVGSLR
jgi:2-polyprenyl-6-methoxyphenol hydroxylase-like FAD-dependent oxidoreductase